MAPHHPRIVSKTEWLRAREAFLAKEKALTRQNDLLARERRELPWTRVEKSYVFTGAKGKPSLADLFAGRGQLATYHFMFGPDWEEGCPGCSYLMDHISGAIEHLAARDVSLVLVSRAPLEKLTAFQLRMGWRFTWVSSGDCDFNRDFGVLFSQEEVAGGANIYNFGSSPTHGEECPGLSYFHKDASGDVFHTYSTFARGLEAMVGTYALLDLAPKGRDEDNLNPPMQWVRHHDKYAPSAQGAATCCHKDCQ